jgi:hypothetical protein
MLSEDNSDDHVLVASERATDSDSVALADEPMRLRALAVDFNLATFAGPLGLGARAGQAADVEPDVEPNGLVHHGHVK